MVVAAKQEYGHGDQMKAHIIENGVVVNTIVASELGEGMIDGSAGGIGWLWDGENLTAPVQPVAIPQSVTMPQARKALIMSGVSIAQVDATINAIEDATERELAETDWEYSATVRRDSPLVITLGPLLELTESQIDDLFILAETL